MRPTQKGGSVVEESTLSTGLALHKEQEQEQVVKRTFFRSFNFDGLPF